MIDKTFKYLKIGYYSCITVVIVFFILVFQYVAKHNPELTYVGLERWSIIITLLGIFATLKYLHPKILLSKYSTSKKVAKAYALKYFLRLIALLCIYAFNLTCYILTGSKNFIYLAFIIIFALFLCAPNKSHIEDDISNIADQEIEETEKEEEI